MKLVKKGGENHREGQSRIQKDWGECGDSQAGFTDESKVSNAMAEGKQ